MAVDVPVAVKLVFVMDAVVAVDVTVEPVVVKVSQPMPSCLQHQVNFAADHPAARFSTPAEQLKGSVVSVVVIEVPVRVPDVIVPVTRVSVDVTVRVEVLVTTVSDDVVEVLVTDVAVGWHPTPTAEQQNSFFSCDQLDRCALPEEQLYSNGVSARRTCVITMPSFSALSGEVDVAPVAPSR